MASGTNASNAMRQNHLVLVVVLVVEVDMKVLVSVDRKASTVGGAASTIVVTAVEALVEGTMMDMTLVVITIPTRTRTGKGLQPGT